LEQLQQVLCPHSSPSSLSQTTGFGGTTKDREDTNADKFKDLDAAKSRQITVRFEGTVSAALPWKFEPSQTEIRVVPGETALAFYRATNLLDEPVIGGCCLLFALTPHRSSLSPSSGVSTYNVMPMKAGVYFNKVQCSCFEEQRLLPKETIEMPVLFYLDPAMLDDRAMRDVDRLTLSYTFFRSLNDGMV
jgi:cytochrome c oxidase assembly protein subunit 11